MNATLATLPQWAMLTVLLVNGLAGLAMGDIYFRMIWHSARSFGSGGNLLRVLLLALLRVIALGLVLALLSQEGALPLLVATLGFLIARLRVIRRFGKAPA